MDEKNSTEEECPVPYPGDAVADKYPNGWEVRAEWRGSVVWDTPDTGDQSCDAAVKTEEGPWQHQWCCTRDEGHPSRWHVAENDEGKVVAAWIADPTPRTV